MPAAHSHHGKHDEKEKVINQRNVLLHRRFRVLSYQESFVLFVLLALSGGVSTSARLPVNTSSSEALSTWMAGGELSCTQFCTPSKP